MTILYLNWSLRKLYKLNSIAEYMRKSILVVLIIFAIFAMFFISEAYLKSGGEDNKIRDISGKLFIIGNYCGGANPGNEILEELSKPKIYPNAKLFVTKAIRVASEEYLYDKRYRSVGSIIKEFSSDENGDFTIELEDGIYCFLNSEKETGYNAWRNEYCKEICLSNESVDSKCENYNLEVKKDTKNIKIRLYEYCKNESV